MRNANVKDYKKGVKKITKGLDNRGPIPTKFVTETALRVPAIFGRTVEGVRIPLALPKGTKGKSAAVGAAGSAAFFGQGLYEAGGAVKDTAQLAPAPVYKALQPAGEFVGGVAAVPLAARYAPGAVVKVGGVALDHPIATAALATGGAGAAYIALRDEAKPSVAGDASRFDAIRKRQSARQPSGGTPTPPRATPTPSRNAAKPSRKPAKRPAHRARAAKPRKAGRRRRKGRRNVHPRKRKR